MFRQVLRRYPPATSLPRLARPSYSTLLSTRTTLLPRAPLPPLHGPGTRSISLLTTGTHRSLRVADNLARATAVSLIRSRDFRAFHATPRNDGLPVLPFLAGFLKASVAMDIIRTAARIALTFLPVVMLGSWQMKRKLRWAESRGDQELVNKIKTHMNVRHQRHKVIFFYGLLILPVVIFWATILASMERTPLTGRWRLILLSPEEEEEISAQLAGNGWYQAVGDILSQEGDTPAIVPPSDWRFLWVRSTLRRLESVIPLLQKEGELEAKWLECGPDDIPLPPPADYPLRPRPRASEFVRRFAELSCGRAPPPVPHGVLGPPYSLIVVDKPDSSNAFSYGFGPDGGGGIVVFSGFLDDIMSKYPPSSPPSSSSPSSASSASQSQQQRSWLSSLFGGLFPASSSSSHPQYNHPMPTEEQTSELAILLAHELAHLILSHHLETLSSGSIIWPGILSIGTDVIRALIFPFTMMFGPFVNDALAGIGKAGSGEFTKLTEYCTSQKQEVEADVVSARLLAHAGFDPRHAVRFWEERANEQNHERTAECTPMHAAAEAASYSSYSSSPSSSSSYSSSSSSSPSSSSSSISTQSQLQSQSQSQIQPQAPPLSDKVAGIGGWELAVPMRWMGTTHPYNVVRVGKLRDELKRWERKREEARRAREEAER